MRSFAFEHTPIQLALQFAREKHAGQVRKYSGEPYINHPMRVARTLMELNDTADIFRIEPYGIKAIQAALLHDVIEDCEVTEQELTKRFGVSVATSVRRLTSWSKRYPELVKTYSRLAKKSLDFSDLSQATSTVQTIKLADRIDNLKSIPLPEGRDFLKVYLKESELLHSYLTAGDFRLLNALELLIAKQTALLEAAG